MARLGKKGFSRKSAKSEQQEQLAQFTREMVDFVYPQMGKKARRQYEDNKYRALGGTVDKGEKMSKKEMEKRRLSRKRKEEKEKEAMEEFGYTVKNLYKDHVSKVEINKKNKERSKKQKMNLKQMSLLDGPKRGKGKGGGGLLKGANETTPGHFTLGKALLAKYSKK